MPAQSAQSAQPATSLHMLQSLLWPEPGLCTERDLYVRLSGPCGLSLPEREIQFSTGGQAHFDSYNNVFNSGKWFKHCGLERLWLTLSGAGRFELVVFYARPDRSWDRVINRVITLSEGAPLDVEVTPQAGFGNRGVLFFELRALEPGVLHDALWQTDQAPRQQPQLMLSVTSFRREAAVTRTAARFAQFVQASPLRDHLHLTIVDNGQTLARTDLPASDQITLVPNANLGGSGGFARGLLAAKERGADYCLFMDDDASVHMDAIVRTWTFLAYATDPNVAIAGAVNNAQHSWQLWENGALFDKVCLPQHMGTDLRDIHEVTELEFDSSATQPHNFYGGWWYFAFPVAQVQHMPFPFFVRGDDVSFSLVHDFDIVTLPGVISFQDEDFSVKETPLTVYLDLRSHLAHHLSLSSMEIGKKGITRIALRFYLRSLLMCHYETIEAMVLALEDVRKGPEFFAQNADMAQRRADIGALTQEERWQPSEDSAQRAPRGWLSPGNILARTAMKLTLNGHLLPFFTRFGNRITLPASKRGARRPLWGASEITYLSVDGTRSYTVRHSKTRALRLGWQMLRAVREITGNYDALRAQWHKGYDNYTTEAFWKETLEMDKPS